MNKIAVVSLLALLPFAAQAAHASDIGLASSTYDWSGAYVGLNLGGARSDVESKRQTRYTGSAALPDELQDMVDGADDRMSSSDIGFTGGVSAGYNFQYDQVVFGIETDLNFMGLDGSMKRDVTGVFDDYFDSPLLKVTDKMDYSVESFGTLRGRLGFAVDNLLIYGTGGLAYGFVDADAAVHGRNFGGERRWRASDSEWTLGWTAGGGIEYGLDRWSIGAEMLYVDLSSIDMSSPSRLDLAADWDAATNFTVLRATGKMRF
jgi:outer membrane immunogenic protein